MEDYLERSNIHQQSRGFSSGQKYQAYQDYDQQSKIKQRTCASREGYSSIPPISQTSQMRSTMGTFVYNTPKKFEKSANFFKDTRIDSCSYVKSVKSPDKSYLAVPFYEKPLKTVADSMNRSTYNDSFSHTQYRQKTIPYAGMGQNKPLERYNPNSYRSRLNTSNDFYYPRNKISTIQIGDRTVYHGEKNNIWKTTNQVEFPAQRYSSKHTNHSGIQAYRVRWDHYLQRKN
ncbi:hypothetical protein TTHERM_00969620 (macronuclear) [Tetrahymena thermophila SB210]|uniref:Uncharacterized protein n=1 Tax=Tetrahymena thermophila (strain SB210) TaxID=312017 RepID=Q24DL2_TETTS|nr:hypothetical protein TTHERM_00969620 [Tetrahymena thermophila SB210]EAS05836.1 hypothetical protein TTHERM_00969620 [Tetrahymena thermophila SB210]|eukprot:XP_001026081.1 hypothetical protein TTHERM_00969620 [Tetrahymena thermophila SB210]